MRIERRHPFNSVTDGQCNYLLRRCGSQVIRRLSERPHSLLPWSSEVSFDHEINTCIGDYIQGNLLELNMYDRIALHEILTCAKLFFCGEVYS